ncbi:hypothetical protein QYF36_019821 [Acer negundo]|nr:hypothetical protein QYF36_019821 [Acer negundo]
MEEPFRFLAQPVMGEMAAVKEKPPDLNSSAKRARSMSDGDENLRSLANESFKSKLVGMAPPGSCVICNGEESVHVAESGSSCHKMASTVNGDKIDSFGLWMQVSYGRNGRNVGGLSVGGKNSSNVGFIGKSGGVAKVGSGSPAYGGEISGKIGGNKRVVGKAHAVVSGRKFANPTKNGKLGNSVLGRSRFAVLSDIVDEDSTTKKVPSKFVDKGRGISPFKENLCGEDVNVCKEGSSGLVENLEDSDVLRSLHVSVMDSLMVSSELFVSIIGGSIGDSGGNSDGVCGSGLQVDISAAVDLDVVASDIRDVIEVALE